MGIHCTRQIQEWRTRLHPKNDARWENEVWKAHVITQRKYFPSPIWFLANSTPAEVYKAAPPELQRQLRSRLSLETPGGSGLAGALPGSLGFDRLSPPPLAAADRRPSGQGFLAVPIKGPSEATGSTGQWSGSGQSLRSWRQDAWKRDDWNDWKEQKEWSSWSTSKESWPQQKKEAWNPKRWGRSRGSWS
ncbi:unnamed protein product [Durusdinium trenchii]|uniref:Uncharacterized protein n=1 Tax=Durusdinium trenchii TaxID=1381693 RepID=A0ABP0M5W9_9DINO